MSRDPAVEVFSRQRIEIAATGREREPDRAAGPADDDRPVVLRAGRARSSRSRRRWSTSWPGSPRAAHSGRSRPARSSPSPRCSRGCCSRSVGLLRVALDVQSSMALFERIFEYLDLEPAIMDAPDARRAAEPAARGPMSQLDHVWFRYPSDPPTPEPADDAPGWTLRDLSLRIEPGQLAAFVGPSGAGKTTISYLVPRLYDRHRGRVRSTGRRAGSDPGVARLDRHRHAGDLPVPRHDPATTCCTPTTTPPTRRWRRGPRREHPRPDRRASPRVRHRGRRARLPAVGRREAALAIARVILKDPAVLILDEATSALDTTRSGWCRRRWSRCWRADHDRDRAPAVHDPRGRRDLRGRRRAAGRARHARGAARASRVCTRRCTASSSAAARSRPGCADGLLLADGTVIRATEPAPTP